MHELLRVYSSRADIPKAEALKEERQLNELDDYVPLRKKFANANENQKSSKQISDDLNSSRGIIKRINEVCVTQVHYYSLLVTLILLVIWLILGVIYLIFYLRRRHKKFTSMQNLVQSSNSQLSQLNKATDPTTNRKVTKSQDAIYSDVSMVERPRSFSEMQYGSVLMNIY